MRINTVERVELVVKVGDKEARYVVNQSCKITNAVIDLVEWSIGGKGQFKEVCLGFASKPKTVREWSDKYSTELLALQALGLRPEQAFYVLQDLTDTRWN